MIADGPWGRTTRLGVCMGTAVALAFGLVGTLWLDLAAASPPTRDRCLPAVATAGALQLTDAGRQAMTEQRYAAALACFVEARALRPETQQLYNIARALEFLQRWPEAYDALAQFEVIATPELRAQVPQLSNLKQLYRGHVGLLMLQDVPDGASIAVQGQHRATAPLLTPLAVPPGQSVVTVDAPGKDPFTVHIAVAAGQQQTIRVQLVASPLEVVAQTTPTPAKPALAEVSNAPAAAASPTERAMTNTAPNSPPLPDSGFVETASASVSPSTSETNSEHVWRTAQWVSLGIAGLGAGFAVFSYAKAASVANDLCGDNGDRCVVDSSQAATLDNYTAWRNVYPWGLTVAGLGAVGFGVSLWQGNGTAEPSPQVNTATVSLSVGPSSILLNGSF